MIKSLIKLTEYASVQYAENMLTYMYINFVILKLKNSHGFITSYLVLLAYI